MIMSALFLEAAWIVGVALAFGSGFLARASDFEDPLLLRVSSQWILLSSAGLLILLAPLILVALRDCRLSFLRTLTSRFRLFVPPPLNLFGAITFLCFPFLLVGIACSLILKFLDVSHTLSSVELAGAFAAAWVAGFLIPGASAGMGVREVILIGLLVSAV